MYKLILIVGVAAVVSSISCEELHAVNYVDHSMKHSMSSPPPSPIEPPHPQQPPVSLPLDLPNTPH